MPIRHVDRPELGAEGSSVGVFCDSCGEEITRSTGGAVVTWDEEGTFRFLHKGVCDRRDTRDIGSGRSGPWWEMHRFLEFLPNNYNR